jgi:hypothetical protein
MERERLRNLKIESLAASIQCCHMLNIEILRFAQKDSNFIIYAE